MSAVLLPSMPLGQSLRQTSGQVGGVNLLLCCFDVVGNSIEGDNRFLGIEQSKGRSWIAIARLSNRSRIDQIAGLWEQLHLKVLRFSVAIVGGPNRDPLLLVRGETTLDVRMTKKCYLHWRL